jgi:SAM-dependent methyltransferase
MAGLKLHLGCGKSVLPGYIGVDLSPQLGVSVVCDLSKKPWPFEDSSVEQCVMFNLLEHLSDTIKVMEELWRVSRPGGIVHIQVPYYNSAGAFQDPTHVKFFTERTFDYFTEDGATELSHYNYYSRARFEIVKIDFHQRRLLKQLPRRVQIFLAHHLSTVQALDVVLKAVKPDSPGF